MLPEPIGDHIQLGLVLLNDQIIISKNVKEGDLGVYFSEGLQLSEEFCTANDLISRKDENGNRVGGFFEANRRVRALKLRGYKSFGFWTPLSSLSFLKYDLSSLKEGFAFDELAGVKICSKYITPATKSRIGGNKSFNNIGSTTMFKKHFDTEQFHNSINSIKKGTLLHIGVKLHGRSFRVSHSKLERKLKWWEKALNYIGIKIIPDYWTYIEGTRNVLLISEDRNSYFDKMFGSKALPKFNGNLHKGETIFGEIVGWDGPNKPIMGAVDAKKTKDKEVEKRYGKSIIYHYDCPNGNFDLYIYRITLTNEDGFSVDLSWEDVKRRSAELGVKHTPEAYPSFIYDGDKEKLTQLVEELTEKECEIFKGHPKEGVVIREESGLNLRISKSKTWLFRVLEGIAKEDDSYEDAEEVS